MKLTQVFVDKNENFENAMRRFKRQVQRAGVIGDIRKKVEYVGKSEARRRKSDAARKRARKEARG